MGAVRDLSEQFWLSQDSSSEVHPFRALVGLEEIHSGLAFVSSFANVTVLDTSQGLVLIDTGSFFMAEANYAQIRSFSAKPVHSAIYTHGHVDHAFGLEPFERESKEKQLPATVIYAHEAVPERFARYRQTAGYNFYINQRQFGVGAWPTESQYREPDQLYRTKLELAIGGEKLELHHARGETDDHTWVWLSNRKVLCTGDLFIWASPNCGNPQKVQRYPKEWAKALRTMATLSAETLLPGHGPPIFGKDRVEQALIETAQLLETLVDQTLELMNQGCLLDEVLQKVKAPEHLLKRPYLRPVYDEPTFIVRNLWRLYGGWWDGNPAHLKPAPQSQLAKEIAALSGGSSALAKRADELASNKEFALACHLIELAFHADPTNKNIVEQRASIYRARAEVETSLMAKGVFNATAGG